MAAPILPPHPLDGLPPDCELSLVFEMEDPFRMPLDRLESLIEGTELRRRDQITSRLCAGRWTSGRCRHSHLA